MGSALDKGVASRVKKKRGGMGTLLVPHTSSLSPSSQLRAGSRLRGSDKLWVYLRWLAVITWCVLLRASEHPVLQPGADLLCLAGLSYCGLLHALAHRGQPISHRITTVTDALLITSLCGVSGGLQSNAYPYFYGLALATAIRFGLKEGLSAALVSTLLSAGLYFWGSPGEFWTTELSLPTLYLFLIAAISGLLSYEAKHRPSLPSQAQSKTDQLLTFNRALTSLDLDSLLQQLADEIVRLVPCRGAGVVLFDLQQKRVDRVAGTGQFIIPPPPELHTSLAHGILRNVLEQGLLVFDSPHLIRTRLQSSPQMQEWARHSLVLVRLQAQSPLGCLVLSDKKSGQGFDIDDTQLLILAAAQAAISIEKAWKFENVRDAATEQRGLLNAIINAQEQERKRVVEEWHDRLGAKVFQVLRNFRACQDLVGQRVPEGKERFEQLAAELDAMAATVRNFTNELHPSVLYDFGFAEALREYIAGLREQEPFTLTLQADNATSQLPNEANLTLFRITQEALRNIRQHAQAKNVQIAFVQEQSGVSLMIKDDGQGFNPTEPLHGQYGLLYMRERAEACGGEFHVRSARGQGTEIRVEFPTVEKGSEANPPRPSPGG